MADVFNDFDFGNHQHFTRDIYCRVYKYAYYFDKIRDLCIKFNSTFDTSPTALTLFQIKICAVSNGKYFPDRIMLCWNCYRDTQYNSDETDYSPQDFKIFDDSDLRVVGLQFTEEILELIHGWRNTIFCKECLQFLGIIHY